MMSLRWAVVTKSGKHLRIYAENRLRVVHMLRAAGEDLPPARRDAPNRNILPAGHWHEYALLERADWDTTSLVENWTKARPS